MIYILLESPQLCAFNELSNMRLWRVSGSDILAHPLILTILREFARFSQILAFSHAREEKRARMTCEVKFPHAGAGIPQYSRATRLAKMTQLLFWVKVFPGGKVPIPPRGCCACV